MNRKVCGKEDSSNIDEKKNKRSAILLKIKRKHKHIHKKTIIPHFHTLKLKEKQNFSI